MEIRLGAFGRLKDFSAMENSGFAYAELDSAELAELSEPEFLKVKERLLKSRLKTEVFGRALPWDQPILDREELDWEVLKEFEEKSCRRIQKLNGRKWILGNGKARSMPEQGRQRAFQQFLRLLELMCEAAEKYGIQVLLEPLGPRYSNFINTIGEAVEVCRVLEKRNLSVMCDLRHMVDSQEAFEDIVRYRRYIRHVHIDNPLLYPQRIFPSVRDGYNYGRYFEALRKIDYCGTLTVEAEVPESFTESFKKMEEFFAHYHVALAQA